MPDIIMDFSCMPMWPVVECGAGEGRRLEQPMGVRGFMTVGEAAEALGLSVPYTYQLVHSGRLESVRLGVRGILVRASAVRKFRRRPVGRPGKKAPATKTRRAKQ